MSDTPFTPFTLGKYRAVELLGKGGFGTVYRAIDTTLDREVALKVLHPQLAADPNFVTRFRQEAKIIAALRHPNVVGVYELGEAEGRLFIAMEYMPGGTLKDRITQQGHLSFDETLRIMQQVCAGLDAAHAKGMIHRDIKPGNILFGPDGQAVVSDFGLARAVQLSSSMSSSSSSVGGVGTSFYKAPELWRGKPPASPATDVYALACMVYEMLTGRILFSGDTPDEVLTKHLIDGPDFGENWLPADAPQGLVEVIQRGIVRNPEGRYATAKAFAEVLSELTINAQREAEARRRQQEAEEQERAAAQRAEELAALEAKRKRQEEEEAARKAREEQDREAARLAAEAMALEAKSQREREEQEVRQQREKEVAALAAQRQHSTEEKNKREASVAPVVADTASQPQAKTPWGIILGAVGVIGAFIVIALLASSNRPAPPAASGIVEVTQSVVEVTRVVDQPVVATSTFVLPTPTSHPTNTPRPDDTPTSMPPTTIPTMIPITPVTQVSDKDGMTLVYVPAGEFRMGAADSDTEATSDEKPQHTVYLDAFWIDQTEVTNAMYAKCVKGGACGMPSSTMSYSRGRYYSNPQFNNYPVVYVYTSDAQQYCQWAGRELPTEAQWEKAARGTDMRLYPWGNQTPDKTRLNYNQEVGDTNQVGAFPAGVSPYGAMDMAGNVSEWVADGFDREYYAKSPDRNPTGPTSNYQSVVRGGDWGSIASNVRASRRYDIGIYYGGTDLIGFRCAVSAQ